MRPTALLGLAMGLLSCTPPERIGGSAKRPDDRVSAAPGTTTASPVAGGTDAGPATHAAPGADAPRGDAAEATATEPVPEPGFPPPDIAPPHERSARPGDGIWTLVGTDDASARAARPPRLLAKTRIHPHPTSRFITTTIVAIDLSRATIHFVPGADDPKPSPPLERKTGVIPEAHVDRALAVFNGGFQPRHGWWGMQVDGRTLVRPRSDGCTLAILADGSVTMRPWPDVEALGDALVAYRQTPPCMIRAGEPSPLLTSNDRIFGGNNADRKTRRRSGVGIDAEGKILFFAIGEEGEVRHLAEGLRIAGARFAAQLDINWNWTRFLLIGDTDAGPRITSTLLPNMNHGSRQYVARPSQRDFFYVMPKK